MAKQQNEPADVSVALPFEKTIAQIQLQIAELESDQAGHGRDYTTEIRKLRAQYVSLLHKTYDNLSPWATTSLTKAPIDTLGPFDCSISASISALADMI